MGETAIAPSRAWNCHVLFCCLLQAPDLGRKRTFKAENGAGAGEHQDVLQGACWRHDMERA